MIQNDKHGKPATNVSGQMGRKTVKKSHLILVSPIKTADVTGHKLAMHIKCHCEPK